VGDRYQSAVAVLQALNPSAATPSAATPSAATSSAATSSAATPSAATSSAAKTFHYEVVKLDRNGSISSRDRSSIPGYIERINGIDFEMLNIPSGTFLMGSPDTEARRFDNESPQHPVNVPEFFMARNQVTQSQWRVVASLPKINLDLNPDPSYFKGDNRPVECVSWYDCIEFCARLSQKTGKNYRLPSEAEWEYACRAGTTTPFHIGETISTEVANYRGDNIYGNGKKGIYRQETILVRSLNAANAWGLYNMHGNVLEWCLDDWHNNYTGAPNNGLPWLRTIENQNDSRFKNNWQAWLKKILETNHNNKKLLRGGYWGNNPGYCRSAFRYCFRPGLRDSSLGFRVAVSLPRT
jgi:formylglycine-generating enzyme required for sulfatase activity